MYKGKQKNKNVTVICVQFYHNLDSLAGLRRGIINIDKLGFNCRFRLVRFPFLGLLMGIALRGNSCIFTRIFFKSGPRCRFCLLTQPLTKRFQRNLPVKRIKLIILLQLD